jgi:hypothetical protein
MLHGEESDALAKKWGCGCPEFERRPLRISNHERSFLSALQPAFDIGKTSLSLGSDRLRFTGATPAGDGPLS